MQTQADVAAEAARRAQQVVDMMARGEPTPAGTVYAGRMGSPVRRNQPCPCGSGKKAKKCHGRRS